MAIQNRRGIHTDFDATKMVAGEFAIVQSGDPNNTNGTSVYICFQNGSAKRLALVEDLDAVVGSLSNLETTDKTSIVDAINELAEKSSILFGTSSTGGSTRDKVVTCTDFEAVDGALIAITVSQDNTVTNARFNVNSTGAKSIYTNNDPTGDTSWLTKGTYLFVYNNVNGGRFTLIGATERIASDTAPAMNGTAAVGTSKKYARADHVHPSDTTRATVAALNETNAEVSQLKEDLSELESDGVVPSAEQLLSDNYTVDQTPYLYRQTKSNGADRAIEEIVGGSIVWNQFCFNGNFESTTGWNGQQSSISASNGIMTLTKTASEASASLRRSNTSYGPGDKSYLFVGHVYFASALIKSPKNTVGRFYLFSNLTNIVNLTANTEGLVGGISKAASSTDSGFNIYYDASNAMSVDETATIRNAMLFDLTAMFGSTIADYIYSLEQTTAGAGVAWFKKLFPKDYYAYNAGTMTHVSGISAHETVGFNQWDEEWELGNYSTSTGEKQNGSTQIRSKNKIRIAPNTQYFFQFSSGTMNAILFYDADENYLGSDEAFGVGTPSVRTTPNNAYYMTFQMSSAYGTTYKNDICISLHWDGERDGEYEPYVKHSYPLDDSLTLRGILKLDANNQLYYDGDTYASDGTVTRRYKQVTLDGTESSWNKSSTYDGSFYLGFDPSVSVKAHGACMSDKLVTVYSISDYQEGTLYQETSSINFWFSGMSGKTLAEFKSYLASNPITVVYELATPTTEEAEPYNEIQIVDDFGTEEYVTTSLVPVGHNTKYPANLRSAIERVMEQVPEAPSANGTYVLKATKTSNGVTYAWTAE